MSRKFEDKPAKREATPLLIGLVGPSGTGKTYSALRLATGIQRVSGGDIYFIDTESRRALHYADAFKFRHIEFGAPFSPLDYLSALEHCVGKGAKTIIIDSMSHEHEGPGGVLEWHEKELERMAGSDYSKRNRMTMLAWGQPKAARRRLINTILQMQANMIFCFRAKDKVKLERGKDPQQLGFMPIAGEEFVYELTVKCLLLPGANGVPSWSSDLPGERAMMKKPIQFQDVLGDTQLSEAHGEKMAQWAAGGTRASEPKATADAGPITYETLLLRYEVCNDQATYETLQAQRRVMWGLLDNPRKQALKAAADDAVERIEDQQKSRTPLEAAADEARFLRAMEVDGDAGTSR